MAGLYIQLMYHTGDDPLNLSLAIITDMEPPASLELEYTKKFRASVMKIDCLEFSNPCRSTDPQVCMTLYS